MLSINNQELFEQYYQKEYDFNTSTLSLDDVDEIKKMVREKRVDYALAPIGDKVFEWILSQNSNIRFELIDFESEKIDGMLYIPSAGIEKAYIILNSNKPLINQIFTAMHEYYHYEKDFMEMKNGPYICNFSSLENVNEKRASRFAAEFLLPEDALRNEMKKYKMRVMHKPKAELAFEDYAALSMYLTIKYQMPLKAVIFRIFEEGYIDSVEEYIESYSFIKDILQEVKIQQNKVKELYSCENPFFETDSVLYKKIKSAYLSGLVSREEIMNDAKELELDIRVIEDFFEDFCCEDEDEDDSDLIEMIQKKWRG